MRTITVEELLAAVDGALLSGSAGASFDDVSTDSRSVSARTLFIPLAGERFDGHDYLEAALESGAEGCLCARVPQRFAPDKFYVRVADTMLALKALAQWYRAQFDIPVVQITGSVGKTTTKDMVASVVSARFETLKTAENFNNEIGTPQTLLRLASAHEAAVIETGMDGAGQIRYLGEMVRPTIALITNVGDAHIEFLGSRENILKAKCEIFDFLASDGLAILNGDDALLGTVALPQRILRCGTGEHCAVRVSDVRERGMDGITCTATTAQERYELSIPAPGAHMVYAASMAVAVGEELGLTKAEIERGVAAYVPSGARMRVEQLAGGRILLNDSYNANPQSMAAALRVLSGTKATCHIALLGDMKELGSVAAEGHRGIGTLAGELGIDTLFCVGELCRAYMLPAAQAAGCGDVRWFETKEQAYDALLPLYGEGCALLLKASHFSGRFDLLADRLHEHTF